MINDQQSQRQRQNQSTMPESRTLHAFNIISDHSFFKGEEECMHPGTAWYGCMKFVVLDVFFSWSGKHNPYSNHS